MGDDPTRKYRNSVWTVEMYCNKKFRGLNRTRISNHSFPSKNSCENHAREHYIHGLSMLNEVLTLRDILSDPFSDEAG